jgi:hypothetical protein
VYSTWIPNTVSADAMTPTKAFDVSCDWLASQFMIWNKLSAYPVFFWRQGAYHVLLLPWHSPITDTWCSYHTCPVNLQVCSDNVWKVGHTKQEVLGRIAYFPSTWHWIENDVSYNSSITVRVFSASVMFLLSHCLVMIGGYTYRHMDWQEGLMKYAAEVRSGAMI